MRGGWRNGFPIPAFSGQKEKELIRKAQSRAHPSRLRVNRLPREKLRHQLSLSPVSTRCSSLLPFFLRRFFFFLSIRFFPSLSFLVLAARRPCWRRALVFSNSLF